MADGQLDSLRAALADRYDVQKELGSGGMATVYLATDRKLGRSVALKVLKPELAHALGPERFLREIEISARLHHPHILPLHDSGEADGFLFYVMPFIEGESLRDRLDREKQLPVDDAAQIAREIADGLSYAHSHDVVHRDIKPENILLESGHAVVADFGIARAINAAGGDRLTETGLAIGTPTYMSPEQAGGSTELDGRSDLYSLGCVFFEMLAGQPPFTGPTVESIIQQHLAADAPAITGIRPAVPAPIAAAVARSLAKTPADRFNPVALFAEAIAPTAMAAAPAIRSRPSIGRAAVYAAVAVLAVVGALAVIMGPIGGSNGPSELVAERVVVAGLDNQTGDAALDALGAMAADWIAQGLQETRLVDVIPAATARDAWRYVRSEIDAGRVSDPVSALAFETHAGIVVTGTMYLIGDSLRLQAEATDATDGSRIGTIDPVGGAASAPEPAIAALRERVMGLLAIHLDQRVGEYRTPRQPPNYAAYREWREGYRLFRENRHDDALDRWRTAHALDSTFWLPVVHSFYAYWNRSLWAQGDSIVRLLEANRERLGEFQQSRVDAMHAYIAGDLEGALRVHRRQTELAANNLAAWNDRAVVAVRTNRPREAIEAYERHDPERGFFRGWWIYWLQLTQAYHVLGEHENELAAARRGRQQYPDHEHVLLCEVRALAALQRTNEAQALIDSIPLIARTPALTAHIYRAVGPELRAHGLNELARLVFERALDLSRNLSAEAAATRGARAGLAHALVLNQQWEESRVIYAQLSADYPSSVPYRSALGSLAARLGEREAALRIGEELAALTDPYVYGAHSLGRARIAALLGEREEAVRLLREAFQSGVYQVDGESNHLHLDTAFDSLRGYPPFQELVRPKG